MRFAVALFSCALMMSEITLIRLFSVTLLYHFAFLVLSMTLFGLGAGGIFNFVFKIFRNDPAQWLPRLLLGAAAVLPVSVAIVLNLRFSPYELTVTTLSLLGLIVLVCILPFFFCGLFVSLLFTWRRAEVYSLYAFDLVGAGLGAIGAVWFLEWIGATGVPWFSAVLFVLAALLVSPRGKRWSVPPVAIGLLLVLVLGGALGFVQVRYVKGRGESGLEFEKWNSFSRIAVFDAGDRKVVQIDADAATEILSEQWVQKEGPLLLEQITGMVYQLRPGGNVLIVGPGGGRDVVAASLADSERITGVEINPIIVHDLMFDRYLDFSGRLYQDPRVEIVTSDARNYLERTDGHYDVLQANAVDTWAAAAGGGFTLSESYLYTSEAFDLYLSRLAPEGILTMGRWVFDPPQQMLRVVSLLVEALKRRGIENPGRHIFLASDPSYPAEEVKPGVILAKITPFTVGELELLGRVCREQGYRPLLDPDGSTKNTFSELVYAEDIEAFYRSYLFNVRPPSDDRPFFFFTLKWADMWGFTDVPAESRKNNAGLFVLLIVFALMLVLTVLCFILPMLIRRRSSVRFSRAVYFLAIGLGFMMFETVVIQSSILFLGHPSFSFSTVVFALLAGSGLASFMSGRVTSGGVESSLRKTLLGLVVSMPLMGLVLPVWLELGLRFSLGLRVLWLALPLFAIGLLLGRLFPLGIRTVRELEVPWAWALNGAASVLGSILAVLIAMQFGFSLVLWSLVPLYGISYVVFRRVVQEA
ncbi:MAG: hypothetical protein JSU96_12855 [Acidobacteriota bacterium]|nr:MAG: hypothetical protein JSU96_12855 [Acidobacteriota bacterium]